MNEHAAPRKGALQKRVLKGAAPKSRKTMSDAAKAAQDLCQCPRYDCGGVKMDMGDVGDMLRQMHVAKLRIYRTSLRSVTLQCSNCKLQITMTWHMLARSARSTWSADIDEYDRKAKAARELAGLGMTDKAEELHRQAAQSPGAMHVGMWACLKAAGELAGKRRT